MFQQKFTDYRELNDQARHSSPSWQWTLGLQCSSWPIVLTIIHSLAVSTLSMLPLMRIVPLAEGIPDVRSGKQIDAPVLAIICCKFEPPLPTMNKWCCAATSNCRLTGSNVYRKVYNRVDNGFLKPSYTSTTDIWWFLSENHHQEIQELLEFGNMSHIKPGIINVYLKIKHMWGICSECKPVFRLSSTDVQWFKSNEVNLSSPSQYLTLNTLFVGAKQWGTLWRVNMKLIKAPISSHLLKYPQRYCQNMVTGIVVVF